MNAIFSLFAMLGLNSSGFNKGLDEAVKKGKEAKGALGGAFDAIGKAALGVTAVITGVGAGMAKLATDVAKTSKEINLNSQKLGLSRESYQEWAYILRKSGTNIDGMGVSMKTLQRTMGGLTEDGDKASDAFKAIGLDFDDIKGKTPEEALNLTITALQQMPEGADRTTAALKLLGKGALELAPLLNKSAEETDALRQKAHDMGLVLSGETIDNAGRFNSAMGTIKDMIQGVKMTIGSEFLPILADAAQGFLAFVTGAEGGKDKMQKAIDTIITTVSEKVPAFIEKGIEMAGAFVEGVVSAAPALAAGGVKIVQALYNTIVSKAPELLTAAKELIKNLAAGLGDAFPVIKPVSDAIGWLMDNFKKLLPVITGVTAAFVAYKATMTIIALVKSFTAATNGLTIAQRVLNLVMSANPLGLIIAIIATLVTAVITLWKTNDKFREGVKKIWGDIKSAIITAANAIIKPINTVIGALNKILGTEIKPIEFIVDDSGAVTASREFADEMSGVGAEAGNNYGEEFSDSVADSIEAGTPKASGAAGGMSKSVFEKAKEWIEKYRQSTAYLAKEELKMWEQLTAQYAEGSEERLEIDKNIAELRQKITKDEFDRSKRWIDKRKYYGMMSLKDEIEAWERVQARYIEGASEREEADKALFDARQRLNDEQQKIYDQMADTEKRYADAVDNRAQAIFNTFGLFAELKEKEKVDGKELTKNLKDQVKEMQSWADNIRTIAERGIDGGLLAELQKMGPAANAEIASLAEMTDKQLEEYSGVWAEKQALAREQAVYELQGLRQDTNDEIAELAASVDSLLLPVAENVGDNWIQNIITGLEDNAGKLYDKIKQVAAGAGEAFGNIAGNVSAAMSPDSGSGPQTVPITAGVLEPGKTGLDAMPVLETILQGFSMVSDTILDALPEKLEFFFDTRKVAEALFATFHDVVNRRGRMWPTEGEIRALAAQVFGGMS
jgi:phage-related protein